MDMGVWRPALHTHRFMDFLEQKLGFNTQAMRIGMIGQSIGIDPDFV